MKKSIKRIFYGVLIGTLMFSSTVSAKTQSNTTDEKITIISEYKPTGDSTYKYVFVDKGLEGTKKVKKDKGDIQPNVAIYDKYSYSYYTDAYNTLKTYDYRTYVNPKFLISVAAGQTKYLSNSITVSGTVSYSQSVSAGIKDVCNASLTGSVSGTVSYTHTTSDTFTGPSSPYTSRDYYSAINYDLYTCVLDKHDVYDEMGYYYDSNGVYHEYVRQSDVYEETSQITVNDVQSPKVINYSKDYIR